MEEKDVRSASCAKLAVPKRTVKDSVFSDLFGIPKYLFQLYKALHPEDTSAVEQDISNVTMKNVLMVRPYNDLGFVVRGKLLIMSEAQSTWSVNVVVRILLYFAETWRAHIVETEQNPYGSSKLDIPEPEFYVVFTGERKDHPEYISLSQEFLPSKKNIVDLRVKVIYGAGKDILSQYITFAKVLDRQIKEKGRTREAVVGAIRICKDADILREYLQSREQEVVGIMMTLFDQEYLNKIALKEAQRGAEARGETRGRIKGRIEALYELVRDGLLSLAAAARKAGQTEDDFRAGMASYDAADSAAAL